MSEVKEAMNKWGRAFLMEIGYDVAEDADITFEDDIESSGYCETCYSEWTVVRVSDGNVTRTYDGSMIELLDAMTRGVYY